MSGGFLPPLHPRRFRRVGQALLSDILGTNPTAVPAWFEAAR
jgi:hypothetical protein